MAAQNVVAVWQHESHSRRQKGLLSGEGATMLDCRPYADMRRLSKSQIALQIRTAS